MIRTGFPFLGLAAVLLAALPATRANAQNARSYVSGTAGNMGNCTIQSPCLSLVQAIGATIPGGEVFCLDGAQSNVIESVSITKSITIDCHGGSTYAVVINGAGISVVLRNLVVDSFNQPVGFVGTGIGIDFQNGDSLVLENCVVERWNTSAGGPGIGIRVAPPDGVTAKVHVIDSLITGNGLASSGGGIVVQPPGSGSARVVIERTRVENNTYGIFGNGTGSTGLISVQVDDSIVSNSAQSGISSFSSAGHSIVSTVVEHSRSLLNGTNGILSQGPNAFVFLSDTTVMSNVTGLNPVAGGAIFSYQNNRLTGNVSDGAPTGVLTMR